MASVQNNALVIMDDDNDIEEPKKQVRLTEKQRLQVAIWAFEGRKQGEIAALCAAHNMPTLTSIMLVKVRADTALMADAQEIVESQALSFGLSKTANRVRKLQALAEKLEEIMEETGIMENSEKVIGFGKNVQTVTETKFAYTLVKEYRETLKQIRDELQPIQSAILNKTQINIFADMSPEEMAVIKESIMWKPVSIPEFIETEVLSTESMPQLALPDPETKIVSIQPEDLEVKDGEYEELFHRD